MKRHLALAFTITLALRFAAAETRVALGTAGFADTEAVTNVAFAAERNRPTTLRFDFNVAQHNNAEVVFGCDADGDGVLSEDEERIRSMGCRCVRPTG